jgi:hypothetical protein
MGTLLKCVVEIFFFPHFNVDNDRVTKSRSHERAPIFVRNRLRF